MEVKELGHVVLYVSDLERSRRFYADVLGWGEIMELGGHRRRSSPPGGPTTSFSCSRLGRTPSPSLRVGGWASTTSA